MEAPNINMLSEAALQELLDIRRQITALQQRYDAIIRAGAPACTPSAPAAVQPPQPAAPAVTQAAQAVAAAAPARRPAGPSPILSGAAVKSAAAPVRPGFAAASPSPRAAAAPAPAQPRTAQQPTEAEQQPVKVSGSVTSSVREAIVNILAQAGKPLPFNTIYSRLQMSGAPLPEAKPMLVVRKLLHDTSFFEVAPGGMFQLKVPDDSAAQPITPDALPAQVQAEPAPAPVQAPPSPAPVMAEPAVLPRPAVAQAAQPQEMPKPTSSFSARLDAILNQ